jgi:polar amino acid transport system ATP-binding protein
VTMVEPETTTPSREQASVEPVIAARELRKSFNGAEVLKGTSLSIARGRVAAIIGPSGGGKSTLLRCINHLTVPDEGEVRIQGTPIGRWRDADGRMRTQPAKELRAIRARMPMVFQRFNLVHHRTALGNVIEPQLRVLGRSKADARARAEEVLDKVGLTHRLGAYPHTLSGGEQQRVGIARALAMDPEIILFDEPTSSLDPEMVGGVLDIIGALAGEGMTMLIVTHEMTFARDIADRVYFLEQGVVAEEGSPQEVFESEHYGRARAFARLVTR